MKKLTIVSLALSIFLVACGSDGTTKPAKPKPAKPKPAKPKPAKPKPAKPKPAKPKPAKPVPSSDSQQWLDAHNTYRRAHQVADVKWSDKLATSASQWARKCSMNHSNSSYGENMYFASGFSPNPAAIVKNWYKEVSKYNFKKPGYKSGTGHFTQVVWKSTTHIGCAMQKGCAGKFEKIAICQYSPAGNYTGRFPQNVFPKK